MSLKIIILTHNTLLKLDSLYWNKITIIRLYVDVYAFMRNLELWKYTVWT